MHSPISRFTGRRFADFLLFGVTAAELAVLFVLTSTFTAADWIYVGQHLLVLGIALTRPSPAAMDRSALTAAAVVVAYAYPYAQVAWLRFEPGDSLWPEAGLVLVVAAAILSLASLLTLGRSFGVRPALRRLATTGPYRLVRHPMYFAYLLADIGYNFLEWNAGTALLVAAGWVSLVWRIRAEERVLCSDPAWADYAARVRFRLLPGVW